MELFTPYAVKDMKLRNRIVMPPMCMYCAGEDGMPSSFHFSHYTARAVGGTGLIIIEATGVLPRGRISDHCLGLWNDEQAEALAPIVAACQEQGAKMAVQLNHAGRKCEAKAEPFIHAPSAIAFDENSRQPLEMTEADMKETVAAFRAAAKRAADIGFDAIEIHAAHGYLLNEFLSPLTNHRTDGYGGSVENRCRFVIEVLEAVHEVWPADKPILLRVSAEDYDPAGMHPEEMAEVLRCLRPYIDIVDVSTGGVIPSPPSKLYPGYQVKAAEYLRQAVGLPVITVGLIVEPRLVEEILGNRRADLVAMGRELLRNPYWVLNTARDFGIDYPWPAQYARGFKVRK